MKKYLYTIKYEGTLTVPANDAEEAQEAAMEELPEGAEVSVDDYQENEKE